MELCIYVDRWIKENAISQRNLTDYAKYELVHDIEKLLLEIGKKKKEESGDIGRKIQRGHMSQMTDAKLIDNQEESIPEKPKHSTREILIKKAAFPK